MANPKRKSGISASNIRNRRILSAVSRIADFESLVRAITDVHNHLSAQAGRAVNVSQTMRNWFIGVHIAKYELHGADRAKYGENLFTELAKRLTCLNVSNCNRRNSIATFGFTDLTQGLWGRCPHNWLLCRPSGKERNVVILRKE